MKTSIYVPLSDLAASWYFDRASEVLENWTLREVVTVNDAIDIHQCKKLAATYGFTRNY